MAAAIVQVVGYIASVLLAISLLVTNDFKFRWLNTFGCISFVIYGILINALPIILTNSILLVINLFYLIRIYRTKENFDLLEIKRDDKLVNKFLSFYHDDIKYYFPDFKLNDLDGGICFVVLRDIVIANIFAANIFENGKAFVTINYTVPKYRDYKVGKFIFEKEKKYLVSKGIKTIMYKDIARKDHEKFLGIMGFKKEHLGDKEYYTKNLG